jgi:hypothetical protein
MCPALWICVLLDIHLQEDKTAPIYSTDINKTDTKERTVHVV